MVTLGHRGRGQAAQVPADVPSLRARDRQQARPPPPRRLRPRPDARQHRRREPRRADDAGQRHARARGSTSGASGSPRLRAGRRGSRCLGEMTAATLDAPGGRIGELARRRSEANAVFFNGAAADLATCCHRMAERFARGGRLVALGHSPAARSDVRHVAVEFVHPVIVGKRALPAIGLTAEGGSLTTQVEAVVEPDDIAIGFGVGEADAGETVAALAAARGLGAMTIAFAPAGAEWEFEPPTRGPVRPPGADRDALPRALGARPRLLRPSRPPRGAGEPPGARRRRVQLPLPVPRRSPRATRPPSRRTCAAPC